MHQKVWKQKKIKWNNGRESWIYVCLFVCLLMIMKGRIWTKKKICYACKMNWLYFFCLMFHVCCVVCCVVFTIRKNNFFFFHYHHHIISKYGHTIHTHTHRTECGIVLLFFLSSVCVCVTSIIWWIIHTYTSSEEQMVQIFRIVQSSMIIMLVMVCSEEWMCTSFLPSPPFSILFSFDTYNVIERKLFYSKWNNQRLNHIDKPLSLFCQSFCMYIYMNMTILNKHTTKWFDVFVCTTCDNRL